MDDPVKMAARLEERANDADDCVGALGEKFDETWSAEDRVLALGNIALDREAAALLLSMSARIREMEEAGGDGFWRDVIGGNWVWLSEEGRKRGKHGLGHFTHVKTLLERLKETDPLGADTLAALVFWKDIEAEREKKAWARVRELEAEVAALTATAPKDKDPAHED